MSDAELNAAVAVEVMGWKYVEDSPKVVRPCHWRGEDGTSQAGWWMGPHPWGTDIAHAWEVVERMQERFGKRLSFLLSHDDGYGASAWSATFWVGKAKYEAMPPADTAPRAICEAALAAVRAEKGDDRE